MSLTTNRRIWVQLWDSKGVGYKGATADFVRLPEDAIVADVRDAIHAKNPNKLADVDVSDLAVYKNAAHFHARQTEGPLRASAPLNAPEELEEGALGASEDEALIVLVPSSSGTVSAQSKVGQTSC